MLGERGAAACRGDTEGRRVGRAGASASVAAAGDLSCVVCGVR